MKKILAMALSVAIIATIAISGTIAYFTDTKSAVNTFTVGNVVIQLLEEQREIENGNPKTDGDLESFEQNKNLMPAVGSAQADNKDKWGLDRSEDIKNYVDKIVRVKNTGKSDAWVRIYVGIPSALDNDEASKNVLHFNYGNRFDAEKQGSYNSDWNNSPFVQDFAFTNAEGKTEYRTLDSADKNVVYNGMKYNFYCFTCQHPLEAGDTTAAAIVGFYLDKGVDYIDETNTYTINGTPIDYDLGKGVTIPVFAQAVQAEGFVDEYKDPNDPNKITKHGYEDAFEAFTTKPWATEQQVEAVTPVTTENTDYYYISNAAQLRWFAQQVNENKNEFNGVTVKLTADIDLKNEKWTPIGQSIDGMGDFLGIFDGQGHTISNLNVDTCSETNKNYSAGLFGWLGTPNVQVKDLKIKDATVNGHHNVGVIAGYSAATITGCTVENAIVYNTHADSNRCGDKTGVLVGYMDVYGSSSKVSGCTVKNCSVSGAREVGQLVGMCQANCVIENNTVDSVTVSAVSGCTDAKAGTNIGGIVGRDLRPTT